MSQINPFQIAFRDDPFAPTADQVNAWNVAARRDTWGRSSFGRGEFGTESGETILVKNTSGAARKRFEVLGIADSIVDPASHPDGFKRILGLVGVVPTEDHADKFVILPRPVASGRFMEAYVSGRCRVQIDVTDESHSYAQAIAGDCSKLASSASGSAQILWKESGTGTKWAVIRFGGGGGAVPAGIPLDGTAPPMAVLEIGVQTNGVWSAAAPAADGTSPGRLVVAPDGLNGPGTGNDDWFDVQRVQVYDPTPQTAIKKGDKLGSKAGSNQLQLDLLNGLIECVRRADVAVAPLAIEVTGGAAGTPCLVVLVGPPLANATVAAAPDSGLTVTPASLTFTPANWNVPQQVVITAAAVAQATTKGIGFSVTCTDPEYSGISGPHVTVLVTPATAPVIVSVKGLVVTEGGAGGSYALALAAAAAASATVTITPPQHVDVGAGIGVPKTLTWLTGQGGAKTVNVTLANDNQPAVSPRSLQITHSISSTDPALAGASVPAVSLAVIDSQPISYAWVRWAGMLACFVVLSCGQAHGIGIQSDKTAWTWGGNNYGQLGFGSGGDSHMPRKITAFTDVISAAAGGYHSALVTKDGTAYTWGQNSNGQCGNGGTSTVYTPTAVLSGVAKVACGEKVTLFLKADRTLWCCGMNLGGSGNTLAPVQVLTDVVDMCAASIHALAVKSDGTAWSWGQGTDGQLGVGQQVNSTTPLQVANVSHVLQVSAGYWHSLFRLADGTVWACGTSTYGELGDGTVGVLRPSPVQVNNLQRTASIASGWYHCLALTADRTLYAWGRNNNYYQLGLPDGVNRAAPVAVGLKARLIGAGLEFSTVTKADRRTVSVGYNNAGQLGTGQYVNSEAWCELACMACPRTSRSGSWVAVRMPGGYLGPCVGLQRDGTAYQWGKVLTGQTYAPVAVQTDVVQISSKATTPLFLKADGTVVSCTFGNPYGEAGDGSDSIVSRYSNVSNLTGVIQVCDIAAGGSFQADTCYALKGDGTVWAWGSTEHGEFGNGVYGLDINHKPNHSHVPVQASISGVIAIEGGYGCCHALKADGTVWAWGYNYYGQLGIGSSGQGSDQYTPVQVPISNVEAVMSDGGLKTFYRKRDGTVLVTTSAGAIIQCVLNNVLQVGSGSGTIAGWLLRLADGSVWFWGNCYRGNAGLGMNTANYDPPVQVTCLAGSRIVDITLGDLTAAAITDGGARATWGACLGGTYDLGDAYLYTHGCATPVWVA